jgi:cell division protein FtsB
MQDLVKKFGITKQIFISFVIALSIFLYFLYYTIFGSQGVIKYFQLKSQLQEKQLIENDLKNKIQNKKALIDAMNLKSLDLDLLDEETRKNLGYAGENEIVIYNEDAKESEEDSNNSDKKTN